MKKEKRIYIDNWEVPSINSPIESFVPFDSYDNSKVQELIKKYKLRSIIKDFESDFDKSLEVARWVSGRWNHSGIPKHLKKFDALNLLENAEKGFSFSCVQFASLFTQCCHALGIVARSVQITTKRPDLGDSGQAHFTAEYFDNDLNKWVWIDPQVHMYAKKGKKLLNFYEVTMELKKRNSSVLKHTKRTLDYGKNRTNIIQELHKFIQIYNGSIQIGSSDYFFTKQRNDKFYLIHQGARPYCTFQGFPQNNMSLKNMYFIYQKINQVEVEIKTINSMGEPKFKDLEDYKKNKSKYLSSKAVELYLKNNMPWFEKYELRLNGKKKTYKSNILKISLKDGKNNFEIRSVNQQGQRGPISKFTICYDSEYPTVRNYW